MKVLVVIGHQNTGSFCHAIADAAVRQLEALGHEVCDVLYFLLRFCDVSGIDVTEAFEAKMRINEVRYPADRVRGSNAKYDELRKGH